MNDDVIELEGQDCSHWETATSELPSNANTSSTGRTLSKKRKPASWVWNHFTLVDDRPTCMECVSKKSKRPVSYSRSTSSGILARHLKVAHRIVKDNGVALDHTQMTLSNTGFLAIIFCRRETVISKSFKDSVSPLQ